MNHSIFFRGLAKRILIQFSPVGFYKIRHRLLLGRWPNLSNPKTFDEKLACLMLYHHDALKSRLADKYLLRSYVAEKGLAHLLPELLGVYQSPEVIPFADLPERFVLKCTHGSGFNLVCCGRDHFDPDSARQKLARWMHTDFSHFNGEIHYAAITPRIIAEAFLGDEAGGLPRDYKFFCFSGTPHCVMVCAPQNRCGRKAKYYFYDTAWTRKLPYDRFDPTQSEEIGRPQAYDVMLNAAAKLSSPFAFVRVDFYSFRGRAFVGEMTFTPSACVDPDLTDQAQAELGRLISVA